MSEDFTSVNRSISEDEILHGSSSGDNSVVPEQMEQWLDTHPQFVHDYFARKGTRSMMDAWLLSNALTQSYASGSLDSCDPEAFSEDQRPKSKSWSGSGENTPVRKISSIEFDLVGTRPILVTSSDGTPTFIRPHLEVPSPTPHRANSRRSDMHHLDEREFMHELILNICHDLDLNSLCFKILTNLCLLLRSDRCSLFLVETDRHSGEKVLVSRLFDVTANSSMEDSLRQCGDKQIRVPMGMGIMGHVAETGEYLNIADAYKDPRFNDEVDRLTGYSTRCILCMPLTDREGEVLGVAQAVNKTDARHQTFSEHDVKTFESYLAFCGIGLRNAQLFYQSTLETRRNQVLLDLARVIFEEQSDLEQLIYKIMMHTQSLLQCARCQVILVTDIEQEKVMFSRIFDFENNDDTCNPQISDTPRFSLNVGITGYVARSGETVNIPDAYKDVRFDGAEEAEASFRTKALLCMPIKNASGRVVGVFQLVNKLDGSTFTQADANLLEAFGLFCGLGISNTQMYERAVRAVARQRVALEVLSYHAIAPAEEAARLKKMLVPSARYYKLNDFSFTDFSLSDDDTLKACLRMFMDLDLVSRFKINYGVLCRWILSVKKNYRNVTYHNWRHALNVAQTMFAILKAGGLTTIMDEVTCLALMVACLCHDLDHRGTNNQFQIKTMSPLAQLYSTAVLEHHHFDQCIMLLTTKGNDILTMLKPEEYDRIIKLIEQAILATDLASYFARRSDFFQLVGLDEGADDVAKVDWSTEERKDLLRCMLMTACDVAAITKPWPVQKKIAELVAGEFFEQGDLEKTELNITPVDMMNRDKIDQLPCLQVGFIDSICLPIYKAVVKVSDRLNPLFNGCLENRNRWQRLAEEKKEKTELTATIQ